MIRRSIYACVILATACLAGCGASKNTLKPTGDNINVTTQKGFQFAGELWAVRESTIYIRTDVDPYRMQRSPKVEVVAMRTLDIKKIEVEGYSDRSWAPYVLIFEGVPSVLLAIAAGSAGANAGGVLLGGLFMMGLNYFFFEISTPSPPSVEQPFAAGALSDLRKYARYPQDFASPQMDSVLSMRGPSVPWEWQTPAGPSGPETRPSGPTEPQYVLTVEKFLEESEYSVTIPWQGKTVTLAKSQITVERLEGKIRITVPARLLQ